MPEHNEIEKIDKRETGSNERRPPRRWVGWVVKILLCLIVLSAGLAGASYMAQTAPKARKRPPRNKTPLVRTLEVARSTEKVMIDAMGTVIPARQIQLKSRVAGEIVSTHPEFNEGGILKKGTIVLQIDPQDYKLALKQKQSQVVNKQYELKLEFGQQDVAKREWELLNGHHPAKALDAELALRKPHLEKVKADLAAAQAELNQAELDLSRTTVRAPFSAVIRTKNVDLGSQVTAQGQLAELVGTDEYWIRAPLPLDRLKWITIPRKAGDPGSRVRVSWGNSRDSVSERTGTLIKILSDLETDGRMARLLVSIKDPLGLKNPDRRRPGLLIGDYVRVKILGHDVDDVVRIPRTALRDNTKIWVAGKDGKLHVRVVETLWRDTDTVLLRDGLDPGERLIVSDLQTPVEGMTVRIEGRKPDKTQGSGHQ